MKKSFLYIVGLIVLMALSCTDEAIVEHSGNGLRITGNVAPDSRTTFVEGDGVIETHWKAGDYVGLYTDEQSNLNYRAKNEGKSTEFESYNGELTNEEGKTVYAYYPYDYYADGDKVHLPSNSEYKAIYKNLANPRPFLYSKAQIAGNTLNFQFKHIFAYLQLKISVQDIKEQLAATQELYPNDGATTEGGWIEINSDNNLSTTARDSYFDIKTGNISGTFGNSIWIYLDNIDFNSDNTYTFLIPILPQPGGAKISGRIRFQFTGSYHAPINIFKKNVPEEGLKAGNVYNWKLVDLNPIDETRKILESFYQKTGGEQWYKNDNWLSDKTFNEWYGINETNDTQMSNNVNSLDLVNNNLSGTIPEELVDIMDLVEGWYNAEGDYISPIDLKFNYLYGSIPESVKNHKLWKKIGWHIVVQNLAEEKELDLSNSNLYLDDIQVEDIFTDNSTTISLHEIFKKNKLTQIINLPEMSVDAILNNIPNEQINLILDYQNKGLSTLIFCGTATETKENNFKNEVNYIYGEVNGIQWLRGKTPSLTFYTHIFDNNGQLVSIGQYNPSCPYHNHKLAYERNATFLRSELGVPEEHDQFVPEIYTSTDYSRDKEVIILQTATAKEGINLVFLGEAFVDKDMEPGGLYEQTMKEAMEQFFSYEPYKSFRNRFNVYAVKAVSPNSACIEGTTHAINHSNERCFEYAQNIPNADKHPLMVTVVYNNVIWDSYMGRSHCFMYDDGSFVAYLYQGLEEASVLIHETGGHGFAGLLDEYVEPGYELLTLPDDKKTYLDNVWSLYGQGANVDWRNDASTAKWAHFLNDSRYANEGLGIYEGAYLYGYGVYRPTKNSMMRNNYATGVQFNAPSREQIYKRIMKLSEGESWTYDYEEFVKYDEINRNAASRTTIKPLTEAERKEYIKNHQPPTFIKGTWRDAMKNGKNNIVVPLR